MGWGYFAFARAILVWWGYSATKRAKLKQCGLYSMVVWAGAVFSQTRRVQVGLKVDE